MTTGSGETIEKPEVVTLRWDVDALKHWRREIDTKVRLILDKAMKVLHMRSERHPQDYEQSEDDIAERVARIIVKRFGVSRIYNNGDGERGGNGEKRLLSWILTIVGLLLVGGVGSGIAMFGKLSAIEKGQDGHEQRINRLEADRDRR
jgi:hypothetical protein